MNHKSIEADIFEAAIEIPDRAERSRYLDKACHGDAQLRRDVECLLEMDDTSGNFLETPAVAFSRASNDHNVGDRIGRYELRERLGEGGFGIVWRADQLEPVRRTVALKIIKLGMDTEDVIQRFEAERQTLARMNHRHIATVLDAACTDQGRPFFVMELVDGNAIDAFCDSRRLCITERLNLFVDICWAVQHAHQRGVIHRDLKPSNILVGSENDSIAPKIIDFGIAKAVGNHPEQESRKTDIPDGVDGASTTNAKLIGTPEYMSPEQLLRDQEIDTRADVYALGAVLHKLLVGVTPVDMTWLKECDPKQWGSRLEDSRPINPSTRVAMLANAERVAKDRAADPKSLSSALSGDLDAIITKALHRNPADRYDTAAELARDIDRHLNALPVVAAPHTTFYLAKKFARRHRVAVLASIAVGIALLLGAFGLGLGIIRAERALEIATSERWRAEQEKRNAEREKNLAERQRIRAEEETAKALQFANFIEELIGVADPEHSYPADFTVREQLDLVAENVGERLEKYPLVEARIRRLIGRVYYSLKAYEKAEPQLRRALAIHRDQLPAGDLRIVKSEADYAGVAYFLGRAEEANELLVSNVERLRAEPPSTELIESLHILARLHGLQDRAEEPSLLMHEAWLVAEKLYGVGHPITLRHQVQASRRLLYLDQEQEAESLARKALDAIRSVREEDHADVAFIKYHLSFVLSQLEQHTEADHFADDALNAYRSLMGNDSPFVIAALIQQAKTKADLGETEQAIEFAREASSLADNVAGGNPTTRRNAYHRLATLTRGVDNQESVLARGKALQIQLQYFPQNNRRLAYSLTEFAFRLRRIGQLEKAQAAYDTAIESIVASEGEAFQLARAYHAYGDLHREWNRAQEAADCYQKAIANAASDFNVFRGQMTQAVVEIDLIELLAESDPDQVRERIAVRFENRFESDSPFETSLAMAASAIEKMSASDFDEAESILDDAIKELNLRRTPLRLITRLESLIADCHLAKGELEACEQTLLRSINDVGRAVFRPLDRQRIQRQLVTLYEAWGKPDKAEHWRSANPMSGRPRQQRGQTESGG
ncbi:MAG: serine/threonine-protein kinase [Planctomycetota bacterium]